MLNMSVNKPFPPINRDVRHSSYIYFLSIDTCEGARIDKKTGKKVECSGNGMCNMSRCTCDNGWHGDDCNKRNCPNSLCFIDIDTLEI